MSGLTWRGAGIALVATWWIAGCRAPGGADEASANDASEVKAAAARKGDKAAAAASGGAPKAPASLVAGSDAAGARAAETVEPLPARSPSRACGTAPKTLGFLPNATIKVRGEKRSYDIFVPASYDGVRPLAVVFVLHADLVTSLRPYLPIEQASGGKAIVVYPYGSTSDGWSLAASSDNADMDFFETLRASIAESYCVDEERFYAFGYSQGGFLANIAACYRGGPFNAIAVNSAGLYAPDGEAASYSDDGTLLCPKPAVPALVIHGTQDRMVSYQGDGVRAHESWTLADGCTDETAPFGPAPCVMHTKCATHPVGFCSIEGMGHQLWQNAATAAWTFFASL